jgi:hypothetical protein
MNQINLAEDRSQWKTLVNTVMNVRFLQNAGNIFSDCTTGGFSKWAELHKLVNIYAFDYDLFKIVLGVCDHM